MVQHLQDDPLSATDSTSNNNDGTVTGATATTGEFNGAASFDGTDDIIEVPHDSSIKSDTDIVASSWIKPTLNKGQENRFLGCRLGSDGFNYQLDYRDDTNDDLRFYFNDGSDFYVHSVSLSSNVNADEWHYITGVFDIGSSSTVSEIYVDGNLIDQTTLGSTPQLNQADLGIGANIDPDTGDVVRTVEGDIDDSKIYVDRQVSTEFLSAEYDASPKAGQVFFSQQAAETTTTVVSATANDRLAFTENTITNIILTLTQSDSLSFTENSLSTLQFTDSDGLTFTENSTQALANTLSDDLTLAENTQTKLIDTLADSLNVTENVASQIIDTLTDSLTLSENTNTVIKLALTVTVSDNIQFSEQTNSVLQDIVAEQLGITENLESVYFDTLSDQLQLQENSTEAVAEVLSDTLGFTEQNSRDLAAIITDDLTFNENIDSQLETALQDTLNLSEETSGGLATLVTDQLQIQENTEKALADTLTDELEFTEDESAAVADVITEQLSFKEQALFASLINIDGLTEAIIKKPNRFVTMQNRTFKQGDLGDELQATLRDRDGKIDLSQISFVDFVARDTKKNKVLDEQVTISDPGNGVIKYQWRDGDFIEDAGVYQAEFRINDNAGNTETVPNDGYVTIEIEEEIK